MTLYWHNNTLKEQLDQMKFSGNIHISAAFTAGLVCFLVYLPTLLCGFVNLDDFDFVVNNEYIRNLDTNLVTWAFTKPRDLWIPLTWMSLAVDYHFWGLNPLGYHLTNNLLHACNTIIVVLIIDRLLKTSAPAMTAEPESMRLYFGTLLLTGLLFGIHPLRVESVAWITERKDVLNGIFTLGSIFCYLQFIQAREFEGNRNKALQKYLLSYLLFCFSLMAKPVSIVLPLLLLLADVCPLKRFRRGNLLNIFVEKAPFLLSSAVLSLLALNSASHKDLLVTYDILPFAERIVVSGYALFEYARLMLVPTGTSPFHAIPNPLPLSCNLKALVSYVIIIVCIFSVRKAPVRLILCLSFVLPLIPVLAFFQNGAQAFASRYTYIPSLGICIAMAFWIAAWTKRPETSAPRWKRRLLITCTVVFLTGYGVMTVHLISVWKDTESLWSRVITVEPVGRAYKERGMYYLTKQKYQAAINDFGKALEMDSAANMPYLYNYFAFRGVAYLESGRFKEAATDFSEAITLLPNPAYFYHRSLALMAMGKFDEAKIDLQRAGGETGPVTWSEL